MQRTEPDVTPWHRQFWPWFLIALPATVVVAGLVTVYIAFNNADTTVNDSYYRDGLAINQVIAQDKLAQELGVVADLVLDRISGELLVSLSASSSYPQQLKLLLLHPTDKTRDDTFTLVKTVQGRYRVDLEHIPQYRYYLRLLPLPGEQWRLQGEIDFSQGQQTVLRPQQ